MDEKGFTREPTVRPATMEGTDPDLTYPIVPPLAVRAPMMKAGSSIPYILLLDL